MSTESRRLEIAEKVIGAGFSAIGLLAGAYLPDVDKGLVAGALTLTASVGANWAYRLSEKAFQSYCERWLSHDGVLNHDIERGLTQAFENAIDHLQISWKQHPYYSRLEQSDGDVAQATVHALNILKQDVNSVLSGNNTVQVNLKELYSDLLLSKDEAGIRKRLDKNLEDYLLGQDAGFLEFVEHRLLNMWVLHFQEILKSPSEDGTRVWRAYQNLWLKSFGQSLSDVHADIREVREVTELLRPWAKELNTQSSSRKNEALYQLPAPLNDFVGRSDVVTEVITALYPKSNNAVRICAICGMGGLGKTQLAIYAAHALIDAYPDMQLFVTIGASDTTQIRSVEDGLRYLIHMLEPTAPLSDDLSTLAAQYRGHLHNKRVLVLLDDVPDDSSAKWFIPPPGCALIVTSRNYLTVRGQATSVRLSHFNRKESLQLFLQDAVRLTDNQFLDAILDRCGDLPLAVRVAAAIFASDESITVEKFLARLSHDKFRRSALRYDDEWDVYKVLELSDDLLMATDRKLAQRWRMLSVCPAPFKAMAVAKIWDEPDELVRDQALSSLVRRSLLEYASDTNSYQMHTLLRDIATERQQSDMPDNRLVARIRHTTYYLNIARKANELFVKGGESASDGLKLFDEVDLHIRSASMWVADNPLPETDPLHTNQPRDNAIFEIRAQPDEMVKWYQASVNALQRLGLQQEQGDALAHLGRNYLLLSNVEQAQSNFIQSLAIFETLNDMHGQAMAHFGLGEVSNVTGDWKPAEEHYRQAIQLASQSDEKYLLTSCYGSLGYLLANKGVLDESLRLLQQAIDGFSEQKNAFGLCRALQQLSDTLIKLGDFEKALSYAEQVLQLATEQGNQLRINDALNYIGIIHAQYGHFDHALDLLHQSVKNNIDIGYERGTIGTRSDIAGVYSLTGNYSSSMDNLQDALRDALSLKYLFPVGYLLSNIGELYHKQGDYEQALFCYRTGLQVSLQLNDMLSIVTTLSNIGNTFLALDYLEPAVKVYQFTIDYCRKIENTLWLCEDLLNLSKVYQRQELYRDAKQLVSEILTLVEDTDDENVQFQTLLQNVFLRYILNELHQNEALAAISVLVTDTQDDALQAAGYYVMWQIDPSSKKAKQAAADLYHSLYQIAPNTFYQQRYNMLTGEWLPEAPNLPDLEIPEEYYPIALHDLLDKVGIDIPVITKDAA